MGATAPISTRLIEDALRRGRNATGIYQGLVDEHGYAHSYESVKRYVRALRGARTPEAHPVITTALGEEGQVDYGGDGPMVRDPKTRKYRRTRLFTLVLGASRKAVRLLCWKSSSEIWSQLHEAAFRRLGGAPIPRGGRRGVDVGGHRRGDALPTAMLSTKAALRMARWHQVVMGAFARAS